MRLLYPSSLLTQMVLVVTCLLVLTIPSASAQESIDKVLNLRGAPDSFTEEDSLAKMKEQEIAKNERELQTDHDTSHLQPFFLFQAVPTNVPVYVHNGGNFLYLMTNLMKYDPFKWMYSNAFRWRYGVRHLDFKTEYVVLTKYPRSDTSSQWVFERAGNQYYIKGSSGEHLSWKAGEINFFFRDIEELSEAERADFLWTIQPLFYESKFTIKHASTGKYLFPNPVLPLPELFDRNYGDYEPTKFYWTLSQTLPLPVVPVSLRSASSRHYLDGRDPHNLGNTVHLTNRNPDGDEYLHWELVELVEFGDQRYAIKSVSSGHYLDGRSNPDIPAGPTLLLSDSKDPEDNIDLQWYIQPFGNQFAILSASSGKYLNGRDPENVGGEQIWLSDLGGDPEGNAYLLWTITEAN